MLQKLEKDGLITIRHGHGTFVAPIDLGAMHDIYVIRMHLMDAVAESTPLEIRHGTLDRLDALMVRCPALKTSHDKQEIARRAEAPSCDHARPAPSFLTEGSARDALRVREIFSLCAHSN